LNIKDRIGEKAGPYGEDASAEKLSRFAQAVGAKPRSAGFPMYLTVCRKGEFDLMQKFGIPLSRVLHGEQEYEFSAPIQPGSKLEYETQLAQVHEKRGSSHSMQFLVFETLVRSGSEKIGIARSTIIYRGESK
jgi:hypothetical protein